MTLSVCLDCTENRLRLAFAFFPRSYALVTRPASTEKRKFNFKTGSHDIIHTFKNYFATVYL